MRFNSFLRFFQRTRPGTTKNKTTPRPTLNRVFLQLEALERREVPAVVPTIVSSGVVPSDGSSTTSSLPPLQVRYSEAMDADAAVATNYVLLGSTGNVIPINAAVIDNGTGGTNTIVTLSYNNNQPLVVDSYTLFVKGDKVTEAVSGTHLAMAQPGQLIVANSGRNNLAVVGLPGNGTLGALSQYNEPAVGATLASPRAIGYGDLDGDGLPDLVVVNAGTNQVAIYAGQPAAQGAGFNPTPDLLLNLPVGAANLGKSLVVTDLSGDGKVDLAIANANTSNVTVFLSTMTTVGSLSFDAGTSFAATGIPTGIVAADFDADGVVDLAVSDSNALTDLAPVDGSADYRVDIFRGTGGGSFSAATQVRVGNVTPTGLQTPTSLVAGLLNNDTKTDLAVGGANGIALLLNTSTVGNISFNALPGLVGTSSILSLAVAPDATGVITNATNAAPIVITSPNHGLATGQKVIVAGVTGNTAANGTWTISVIDANSFTLIGSTGNAAYIDGGTWTLTGVAKDLVDNTAAGTVEVLLNNGTATFTVNSVAAAVGTGRVIVADLENTGHPDILVTNGAAAGSLTVLSNKSVGGSITAMSGNGVSPIAVTSARHGLVTGQKVVITGSTGNTAANGTFTITVADANTFTLNGTTGNGAYLGGASWALTGSIATATEVGGVNPITITTTTNHGLVTGNRVIIAGVVGFAAANGTFTITVVDATHFTLNGTNTVGAGAGGTWTTTFSYVITAASPYSVDGTPLGLAVFDSNQDGKLDVVTANNTGQDVSLLQGNGDGTFQVSTNIAVAPTATRSVQVADLNRDGLLDLIVTNYNATTNNTAVLVYAGQNGGTYATPVSYTPNAAGRNVRTLVDLAVGDVNNDGRLDIFLLDQQDNSVGILLNNISVAGGAIIPASFTAIQDVGVGNTPYQIAVGDFNHDGNLDLAVAHNGFGGGGFGGNRKGVTVRLGNGTGTFQNSVEYLNNVGVDAIAAADFNKDGNLDLVAAEDAAPGTVRLLQGDGRGAFAVTGSYNTSVPNPGDLAIADFNGDGFPDVIVTSKSTSVTNAGVAVLMNQVGTGFGLPFQTDVTPGTALNNVLVNDVNQDGFADILVTTTLPKLTGTISNATNASPIVITSNNHGLTTGTQVQITGVNGNTAANGIWTITVPGGFGGANTFTLNGSTGNAAYTNGGTWTVVNSAFNTTDNVFALVGKGDGTFYKPVPYLAGGVGVPLDAPSTLAATPSPLIRVTTFSTGGTLVTGNLIKNGDFEARDLATEQGNLLGWQTYNLFNSPTGSHGSWLAQTGTTSTLSGTTVPGPTGKFRAMLDESNLQPYSGNNNPNAAGTYAGTQVLYQDVTIPANVTRATLSLSLYLDNSDSGAWSDPTANASLDFGTAAANQQVRVDLMNPASGAITGASNGTPILITSPSHGLTTGMEVQVTGVLGDVAANGLWIITVIDPNTFSLNGSNGTIRNTVPVNGVYAGGGTWTLPILGVTTPEGLLRNVYQTHPQQLGSSPPTPLTTSVVLQDTDLTAFAGKTIRVRIAAVNNRGRLIVGVDNVKLNVTFADSTLPTLTGVGLRSPGFLGAPNGTTAHTNDPTLVGKVSDNSGLGAIAFIEFDPNTSTFGGPTALKTTQWDANGNFSFTLPVAPPGLNTIGIRVVDKAGNEVHGSFTFFVQSNSVTEWSAVGPQGIDVTGQGVNYTTVSGRITATLPDLNDPTGASYFVGSANGGIWKTTDGGSDWTPLTDAVLDGTGTPVAIPIGGLAQSKSNPNTLYAGTGVGDDALDSRAGMGVLKSTDGGKTWAVVGNSATVLAGARITSMVVDANTDQTVYAAVASGGASGPGVYKSTDGGQTWANVLLTNQMFLTPSGGATLASTGVAALASVTNLIIDPFDSDHLFVALGNINLVAASASGGVWDSINQGGTWRAVRGGAQAIANNTLPSGVTVGRVTLAMSSSRVGNEPFLYVLVASVPGNNTPPSVDLGSSIAAPGGLYKSSNNLLDFTKVKLMQDTFFGPPVAGGVNHNFVNINLFGHDAANVGALVVDPSNPNVVYVGGSNRWAKPGDPPDHALIRVDTGNMRDVADALANGTNNNGDDKSKAARAAGQANFYDPVNGVDPYVGEGVYWYDIAEAQSNKNGKLNLLPQAITALSFDAKGRLLVGTVGGIWRGVPEGFGYDFTSGGSGILRQGGGGGFGGGGNNFTAAGMTLTEINGNLQISDMTSVGIDPFNRGVYYTTQFDTGTAGSTLTGAWTSEGLTGPVFNGNNLNIPTAGTVLVVNPNPGAPADAPVTLIRVWQYADTNALLSEASTDNGATWTSFNSAGINPNPPTPFGGNFPPLAVNPTPVFQSGAYQTQLLFGADVLYRTNTTAAAWNPVVTPTSFGLITALEFAPSQSGVFYIGNAAGQVFVTQNNGADNFPIVGTGILPTNRINAIAVDPGNANIAYVLFGGTTAAGVGHVWRTADGGTTWLDLSAGLPNVSANAMVIDPAANIGAPYGKAYVATDVGVYFTTNGGGTWDRLGQGFPNVPVVDLKNVDRVQSDGSKLQVLAAATLGRSVFTINTSPISFIPDQTFNEDTTDTLPFTVNDPGLPPGTIQVAISSSNPAVIPQSVANIILTGDSPSYTLQLVPALHAYGTTTITIAAIEQGGQTFYQTFNVNVAFVNYSPTVTPIAKQFDNVNTPRQITFTVGDVETPANLLTATAVSDNPAVVSNQAVFNTITATTGNLVSPIVVTSANHGLITGQQVVVSGVVGNTAANGTWTVTVVDANNFSLNTSTGNGTYTSGGTWGLTITGVTGNAVSPIVITSAGHGLTTGQKVVVSGVNGNTGANGTWTVTFVDANNFSLNGTVGTGLYTTGGTWNVFKPGLALSTNVAGMSGTAVGPIVINSVAHGLITGQQVKVTGATGNTAANGTWTVTVLGPNTFSLNGTTGTGNYTGGALWGRTGSISAMSGSGVNPISVTSTGHGLTTGQQVAIANATGNTNANRTWTITVIDANTFTLNGSLGNGTYAGGATWDLVNPALATRTLTVTPLSNQLGETNITLTVGDDNIARNAGALNGVTNVVIPFLVTTPQTLPFTDNFNRADNPFLGIGWTENLGDWSDKLNAGLANAPLDIATVSGPSYTNVAVQADFNVSGAAGQAAGLIARYAGSGDQNMYLGHVINLGSGNYSAALYRNVGGTWTPLYSQAITFAANPGTGMLRFEVVGPSLKLFVNGALVAYADDTAITGPGAAGLRYTAGGTVDNFSLTALNPTPQTLTYTDAFAPTTDLQLSTNWLNQLGNVTVTGTGVAQGNGPLDVATVNGITATNVAVQADVTFTSNGQSAGLVARYSGPLDQNMYLGGLTILSATSYTAYLYRNVGGTWTPLFGQSYTGSANGQLRFEAFGPSLKLFLNNALIGYADDSAITGAGTVGVRLTAGATEDNFSASVLTQTTSGLPVSDAFAPTGNQQLSALWTNQFGNFQVTAGGVAQANSGLAVATINGVSTAGNVFVQADVVTANGQSAGLVARYSGPLDQNMYFGGVTNNGSSYTAYIYRNLAGTWTQLFGQSVTGTASGTLRFEVVGSSLKLFLGTALIAYCNDTALTAAGSVGIRATTGATFDNFSANTLAQTIGTLTFTDAFSSGVNQQLSNSWVNQVGNVKVAAGTAQANGQGNVATVNGLNAADVTVSADLVVATGQAAGLVARYAGSGDTNMYWAGLYTTGGGFTVALWVNAAGTWTQLASQPVASGIGTLRLDVQGTTLKVFFTGSASPLITWTDGSLAAGSVGLRMTAGASADNFTASALTVTNTGVPFSDAFGTPPTLSASWETQLGSYLVTAGGVAQGVGPADLATVVGQSAANVAVQGDINVGTAIAANGGRAAGLVARYNGLVNDTGVQNFYLGQVVNTGSGYAAYLFRNVNGTYTQLAPAQSVATGTGTGLLRLEVVGSSLKLFFGGSLVGFANDTALSGPGSAGMRVTANATVDNFDSGLLTLTSNTVPFGDGFAPTADLQLNSNWLNQVGNFQVTVGGTALANSGLAVATVNGVNAGNVAVQADISVTTSGQTAGLAARYAGSGDQNMYVGQITNTGGGFLATIYRNVGGTWTQLSSQSAASGTGLLRFEVAGSSLKLFLAGTLVGFANDTALTTGTVGIRATNAATLDNFSSSAVTLTNGSLGFTDAFGSATNQQLSNNWLNQVGNFQVASGVAAVNGGFSLATVNGLSSANVFVQANVTATTSGQSVGLVARYAGTADQNMYLGMITNNSGSFLATIYRNVGGTWTLLSSQAAASGTGLLRFEVVSSSLKLFLAGTLVGYANDTALTTGAVGMRATNAATLDNFNVNALTLSNATLTYSEDFSTYTVGQQLKPEWLNRVGNFQGTASQSLSGVGGLNVATLNGVSVANVTVQADMTVTGNQSAGLVARYAGPADSNTYFGGLVGTGSGFEVSLWVNVNGTWNKLAGQVVGSGVGTLKMVVLGSTLTLFFGGVQMISITDASLSAAGTVGLQTSAGAIVDNFTAF